MYDKKENAKKQKTVFYLRTDMDIADLKAGGSVAHTLGVIGGFQKLGYRVLCASSAMLQLLDDLSLDGFCVLKQPRFFSRLSFRIACLVSNFFFTIRSLFFLRKKKIDFVYQRYGLLNCVGVIVAWLKRVPLILEFNGSEAWIDKHWVPQSRFVRVGFLIRWIENLNVRRAKHIVVVSQVLKDFLVDAGVESEKILVNPNGVDVHAFDPERLSDFRKQTRKDLHLESKFVFGFVGSFGVWHGIETIAAMIPAVVRQCPHAHFLLVGAGPLFKYLKNELKRAGINDDSVTLTGAVVQAEAKKYLAACDAFLSPTRQNKDGSRFFGSPTKMFEYMSLGKPIIASNLEQLSELLYPAVRLADFGAETGAINKKVGVLIEPDNVNGFIKAACELAGMDIKTREHIGYNARQKAILNYSWLDHTKKIVAVLKK